MKLYDIPHEIEDFERELMDSEGVVTAELQARWEDFVAGGKAKIEAAAMVIRTLEYSAEITKAEAERLARRAASQERNAETLKALTMFAVDAFGGSSNPLCGKIKTPLFTIWTQFSRKLLSIEPTVDADLAILEKEHPEFVRVTRDLNRKAIAAAVEAGEEIPATINVEDKPGMKFLRIL